MFLHLKNNSVFFLVLSLVVGCAPSTPTWEETAQPMRDAFAEQSRKSLYFSGAGQLAALKSNPFNGFCLLLDEALDPDLSPIGPAPDQGTGELAAFEFPRDAEKFFAPVGSTAQSKNSLILQSGEGAYLAGREPLSIPREELSEIEIRLRLEHNQTFYIGLSASFFLNWKEDQMGLIQIPAEPGEEFRTYRIFLPHLFRASDFMRNLPSGKPVSQFFLAAGSWPKGQIEIASIRFLGRDSRYLRNQYGTGYLTSGGVIRRGFWMPVPGKLNWEIGLPALPVFFRSGISLSRESSEGVEFEITVSAGDSATRLAGGVIGDSSSWTELGPLDLGSWTYQTVILSIETRGEGPNTVFWGDPAIRELPRERFNAVVILEDAMRADHLSCYGYPAVATPVTDLLAKEGILFETAISQATMTRPSCPSLMTSLYPSATGVWSFQDSLEERFLTLPEVMRSQGFYTAAFVQNPAGGAAAGLQQGFGQFYDRDSAGFLTEQLLPDLVDEWLKKHDHHNFFLYLHLLKPHGPYDPLPPFDAAFRKFTGLGTPVDYHHALDPPSIERPSREGRVLRYNGEISANDYYIGRFLDLLEKRGLRKNTLVVILSDHGEFLGEDGRWGHFPPSLLPVIHVPLIFSYPRLWKEGRRIAAPVQLLDVMPTVLELAGVPTEPLLLQGKSLLPLIENPGDRFWKFRPVFSEEVSNLRGEKDKHGLGSILWGGKHFLFSNSFGENGERRRENRVFSLTGGGEEPAEAAEEEIAAAYQILLDLQETGAAVNRNIRQEKEKVQRHDPEVIKQLRALGYLQ